MQSYTQQIEGNLSKQIYIYIYKQCAKMALHANCASFSPAGQLAVPNKIDACLYNNT